MSVITILALIEPFNPYVLFWISFGAITMSFAVSVLLTSISNLRSTWFVRVKIFLASCGNLFESNSPAEGSTRLCFNWSTELWNRISILVVEQLPQRIGCQCAFFTLLNTVKNIKQAIFSRQSPTTETVAISADTLMEVSSVVISGTGGF